MCSKTCPFLFLLLFSCLQLGLLGGTSTKAQGNVEDVKSSIVDAYFYQFTDPDSGLVILDSLRGPLQLVSDSMIWSDYHSVRGTLYQVQGEYDQALAALNACYRIRLALGDSNKLVTIYLNLGNLHYKMKQDRLAIAFFSKGLALARREIHYNQMAGLLNSIGVAYRELSIRDSASYFFEKGLNLIDDFPEIKSHHKYDLIGNQGALLLDQGRYDRAKSLFHRCELFCKRERNFKGLAWVFHQKGLLYWEIGKNTSAEDYLLSAQQLATDLEMLELKEEVLYNLTRFYSAQKNFAALQQYLDSSKAATAQLSGRLANENLAKEKADTKYVQMEQETENTREENKVLKTENEWSKGLIIALLLFAGALVTALVLGYRSYNQKQYISKIELDLREQKLKELETAKASAELTAELKGQEEERNRIAQDLHDRLGNTLATLRMALQGTGADPKEKLNLVDLAAAEVRSISYNLSSGILERHGLSAALEEMARSVNIAGDLKFHLYLNGSGAQLPMENSLEVYRISQELTSNTIRHAQAKNIHLQTNRFEDRFSLVFEDDGNGFDPNSVKMGMGLQNIKHRIEKLGGSVQLDSHKGRGTIVIVDIPV